jgi:predicted enzyme related to lactoylglutathione lyase
MTKQHSKDHGSGTTRVTGIGGVFFKAKDPGKLMSWYTTHLGIKPESEGSSTTMFQWREKEDSKQVGYTVRSIFPHDTKYFDPGVSPFMINFRVKDLDRLMDQLRREGVKVDDKREEYEYGRFGWIIDPRGQPD